MDVRLRTLWLTCALGLAAVAGLTGMDEAPLPLSRSAAAVSDLPPLPPRESGSTQLMSVSDLPADLLSPPPLAPVRTDLAPVPPVEAAEVPLPPSQEQELPQIIPQPVAAQPPAQKRGPGRVVLDLVVKARDRTAGIVRRDDGWKAAKSGDSQPAPADPIATEVPAEEPVAGDETGAETNERQATMSVVVAPEPLPIEPRLLNDLSASAAGAAPVSEEVGTYEELGTADGLENLWDEPLSQQVVETLEHGFGGLDGLSLLAPLAAPPAEQAPLDELFSDAVPLVEVAPLDQTLPLDQSLPLDETAPPPPMTEDDVPLSPEVPMLDPLPELRRTQLDEAYATLNKPISSISLTAGLHGAEPRNLAAEIQPLLQPTKIWGAPWPQKCPDRYTVPFCFNPLYFEEPNLERCGINCCCFQPAVSGLHFVGNFFLLPYRMVVRPPCILEPTNGDCPTCHYYGLSACEVFPVGTPDQVGGLCGKFMHAIE